MYHNGPLIIKDSSLLLCMDASNIKSYVSASTNWYDLVSNCSGSSVTAVSYTVAGISSSFTFPSNGQYFNLSNHTRFKTNVTDITLCAWCNQLDTGGNPHQTLLCTAQSYRNGIKLMSYYHGNTALWGTNAAGSADYMITGNNIVNAGWKFVAGTWNNVSAKMYLYENGVQVGTATTLSGSMYNGTQDAAIGIEYHSSAYHYYGNIAYVSAYSRALSGDEIMRIYNATKGRFGK